MPIYSYKCSKCGNVFEKMEKVSDNGKVAYCDMCNAEALRIFSPVGIIFKGSGFYSTDYKSSGNKANLSEKKAEKTSEKKDGSKSLKSSDDTSKPKDKNK